MRCVLLERVDDWEEGGVSDQLMVVDSKKEEETATTELHLPAITEPDVKEMKQAGHLREGHHKKALL